jgi:cytochrome c556
MKRVGLILAALSLAVAGTAFAQQNPIKARQDLMSKNGDATKVVSQMLKGEKPYDGAAAAQAFSSIASSMDTFVTLFPDGSTNKDSDAKPEIWQNRDDFNSWATKVKQVSLKAAQAASGGAAALGPALAEVGQACQGCHEKYRVEK